MKPGSAMSGLGKFHLRWHLAVSMEKGPYTDSCPWMLVNRKEEVEEKLVEVVVVELWIHFCVIGYMEVEWVREASLVADTPVVLIVVVFRGFFQSMPSWGLPFRVLSDPIVLRRLLRQPKKSYAEFELVAVEPKMEIVLLGE